MLTSRSVANPHGRRPPRVSRTGITLRRPRDEARDVLLVVVERLLHQAGRVEAAERRVDAGLRPAIGRRGRPAARRSSPARSMDVASSSSSEASGAPCQRSGSTQAQCGSSSSISWRSRGCQTSSSTAIRWRTMSVGGHSPGAGGSAVGGAGGCGEPIRRGGHALPDPRCSGVTGISASIRSATADVERDAGRHRRLVEDDPVRVVLRHLLRVEAGRRRAEEHHRAGHPLEDVREVLAAHRRPRHPTTRSAPKSSRRRRSRRAR